MLRLLDRLFKVRGTQGERDSGLKVWQYLTLQIGIQRKPGRSFKAYAKRVCRRGFYDIAFLDSSCRVPRNAGSRSRHIVVASTRILHRCQDRAICRDRSKESYALE